MFQCNARRTLSSWIVVWYPPSPLGFWRPVCVRTLGSDNWITRVNVSMHARHELVAFWYGTHPTGHWVYIGLPLLDYVVKFLLTH